MAGQGTLTLVRRGGTGTPIVLEQSGARLSEVLNGPGELSCMLPDATARKFGSSGINWIGKWILFTFPDLPDWGGVVTQVRWTPGQFELVAQSFHVLMRKRRVNLNVGFQRATAGALARRAHSDVQTDGPTGIVEFQAAEAGDPIDYEWRGGDLMDDVLSQLVSASGQEWTVGADRVAIWTTRLGSDKSATVALRHGGNGSIVDYTYDGDLWTAVNDIEGVGADDKYADAAYDQADDDASLKLYGRLMKQIRYSDVVSKGTIRPKILRDLRELRFPQQLIQVRTANVSGIWSRYVLGDEVLICLPGPNILRVARITSRSIDVDAGIETLGMVVV